MLTLVKVLCSKSSARKHAMGFEPEFCCVDQVSPPKCLIRKCRLIQHNERELWLTGLRAERAELYRLRSVSRIDDDTLRSLVDEIDLIEASIRAAGTAP